MHGHVRSRYSVSHDAPSGDLSSSAADIIVLPYLPEICKISEISKILILLVLSATIILTYYEQNVKMFFQIFL